MALAALTTTAERAANTSRHGTRAAAIRNVTYRNSAGKEYDARVIGAGSSSGLKIYVIGLGTIDNVAAATALKQASRYYNRSLP